MPNPPTPPTPIDPSLLKAAIDLGTWSLERIKIADVAYFAEVNGDGVWDKTTNATKCKIRKVVFDLVKAGTVNPNGTITTTRGTERLIADDGYARLVATPD